MERVLFLRLGLGVCIGIVYDVCVNSTGGRLVLLVLLLVDFLVEFLLFEVLIRLVDYVSLFSNETDSLEMDSLLIRGEISGQVVIPQSIILSHFAILKIGQVKLLNLRPLSPVLLGPFGLSSLVLPLLILLFSLVILLLLLVEFLLLFLLLALLFLLSLSLLLDFNDLLILLSRIGDVLQDNLLQMSLNRLGLLIHDNNLLPLLSTLIIIGLLGRLHLQLDFLLDWLRDQSLYSGIEHDESSIVVLRGLKERLHHCDLLSVGKNVQENLPCNENVLILN